MTRVQDTRVSSALNELKISMQGRGLNILTAIEQGNLVDFAGWKRQSRKMLPYIQTLLQKLLDISRCCVLHLRVTYRVESCKSMTNGS